MKREDVIKMFEEVGCKECDGIEGLLDATGVVIDIKIFLKNNVTLRIFCQGTLDFTSNNYAGFKDTLIDGYENIEKIEFGQLY